MSPTTRRVVQISLVSVGLFLGSAIVVAQVWFSPGVCAAADGTVN